MDKPLQEFSLYLESIGYSKSSQNRIIKSAKEFLLRLKRISDPNSITEKHIKSHYNYLTQRSNERRAGGLSSLVISYYMDGIKTYFNYLQEQGLIQQNPMSSMTFEKPDKNPREILTEKQIKKLYKQTENLRDRAILGLFYGCGLRRTEGEKLNIRDIHFKNQLLYVREGKGKKRRVVPMSLKVTEDLRNYYLHERNQYIKNNDKNREEAFVLNNWGRRMSGQLYERRLKYLLSKTDIKKDITLHSLRHSISTHLLERGLKVEFVRDLLGHDELSSTETYTRVSKKQLRKL